MIMDYTTLLVAIISSRVLNTALTYLLGLRDKRKGIQEASRLLMKDRLRFLCVHYIQQGWIYEDELEDLIAMHACYHDDLKGNGFLDSQMERVKNLELRGIGVR